MQSKGWLSAIIFSTRFVYDISHELNVFVFRKLAGKAAKRREFEDMKIIDINEDQMRGDPNVWLTKVNFIAVALMLNFKHTY